MTPGPFSEYRPYLIERPAPGAIQADAFSFYGRSKEEALHAAAMHSWTYGTGEYTLTYIDPVEGPMPMGTYVTEASHVRSLGRAVFVNPKEET